MQPNFDRVYFLGDSLTDTGNFLNISRLGGDPFPVKPYKPGRFSNGNVWTDNFIEEFDLDIDLITNPTFSNDGLNFAIGGGTSGDSNIARDDEGNPLPGFYGLEQQVDVLEPLLKVNNALGQSASDDLFFIWIGANDYFSYIQDDPTTPDVIETNFPRRGAETRNAVIEVVDINIKGAIHDIVDAGGEDIVVFNLPDLDKTPLAGELEKKDQRKLRRLTKIHNRRLSNAVDDIEDSNPDVNIIEVDVNSLFDDIFDNPGEFGITNATDNFTGIDLYAGLNGSGAAEDANVNEYLFFDSVHPTSTVHSLVSDLVVTELVDEGLITA